MFAAQIHVEHLVVAYIEQNLTMYNTKLGWDGDEDGGDGGHNVLEMAALTLEDLVVAHIEQNLPMCNAKLQWGGD